MKPKDLTGTVIDRFTYDTPDQAQADFYALCDADTPLILVFLANFGHPISRVYLTRYMDSLSQLTSGRLACVVRSDPQNIAAKLDTPCPFPLICDAAGALYEYFHVQSTGSRMAWSFTAARIFREAKKQGYQPEKNAAQLLPLTLVVGRDGKVLFSHYGESLTDLPEDCAAMEQVCSRLIVRPAVQPEAAPVPEGEAQAAPETEPETEAPAEETQAPAQDAPDLDAANAQVLFPGREAPAAEEAPAPVDTDHTQQIDLSGWDGQPLPQEADADAQPEPAEADAPEEKPAPRWSKLVNLFADRDSADKE